MLSLFSRHRSRFARRARSRRSRTSATGITPERLEQRIALDAAGARDLLQQASTLVMDQSMGPSPVVMTMQQVAGTDVKSFVISHVPEGSVVEKWDTATSTWLDVSTEPASANPLELMRRLANRVIHQGDRIQWRPQAGFEGAAQQAFEMINWDDGSELLAASAEAPSAVQNLAVAPTGVGELTVTWEAPATGDATSYSITINSGSDPVTYFTSNTSYTFSDLNTEIAVYTFSVTASNAEGTSPAAQDSFGQAAILVGPFPYGLTHGQEGSIWVANSVLGTVQQIANDNGIWTAQAAISVGERPYALTTGLDGSIWVANNHSSTVQQIVNDNGVWTAQAAIGVGTFPRALTTGLDGSIWVANGGSSTVQQIVNDNGIWSAQAAITVGARPCALTTGLDGSIWVANLGHIAFNPFWYGILGIPPQASGYAVQQIVNDNGVWTPQAAIDVGDSPIALTTGLDGSIWVANMWLDTVRQIVKDNGVWTPQAAIDVGVATIPSLPQALTTGLDGSIWVANKEESTVQQIVVPPEPPVALATVFGPGPGEMTLAWQRASDGGSPVIAYTATVSQGAYTKTITTSDTSCVFDGLTLGSGPTYFTVTAANFVGESTAAALQIDAYGNPIPSQNKGIGITIDGTGTSEGGFDGSGNTYSWTALGDTSSGGALVGSSLISGGLAFDLGSPNQPDFIKAAGQDIEATGSGTVLTLAAAAVNGSQGSQELTLNFDDGTTATWTQSFSDWCSPQNYANESIISTQSYRNTVSGGTNDTTNYIYSYGYVLPEGKTLKSITLPNNADVRLLGAVLTSPQTVDLTWGEWGIANGKTDVNHSDGFDGNGNYYYSGTDVVGDLPSPLVWGGVIFDYGPTSTTKDGTDNFVRASGQEISITAGTYSSLCLAAAAANGSQTDQVFTLTFSDGSQETWTQSLSDWCVYEAFDGQAIASTQDYRVRPNGNTQEITNYVYGYSYDIPAGKTLTSITLPDNSNVGILAMALV